MKEKRWMKRSLIAAMVIIAALFCCAAAGAEPAPDITRNCKFNAGSGRKTFSKCKDRDYKTYWRTNNGDKCYVEVTVPAGQSASGVMVQWYEHPHAWGVQVKDESGKWTDAGHTDGSYLAEYLPLPEGTTVFRVANAPGEKRHFNMTELRIYGEGDLPPEAQQWQPSAEKADLMLLVAHPILTMRCCGSAARCPGMQAKKAESARSV